MWKNCNCREKVVSERECEWAATLQWIAAIVGISISRMHTHSHKLSLDSCVSTRKTKDIKTI